MTDAALIVAMRNAIPALLDLAPKALATLSLAGEDARPEDRAEQFIQAAVDSAPEPLRRLGEWLANKLDDDDWKTAERLLNGASVEARSLSSRVERAEQLTYTGAISLASIDEGATRPETWKERAENRQAVFLLAKRRAEAAESEAAALREALRPFVSHYEPWMERQADGDRMCVYPVHTMGDLRRARSLLGAKRAQM